MVQKSGYITTWDGAKGKNWQHFFILLKWSLNILFCEYVSFFCILLLHLDSKTFQLFGVSPSQSIPSNPNNRGEEVTRTVSLARCSPGAVWLDLLVERKPGLLAHLTVDEG